MWSQVTDLALGPYGEIASASLDRYLPHTDCGELTESFAGCLDGVLNTCLCCSTLRLWEDGECKAVLEGHTGAVQCAVYLPSGELVSGSNDNTIRVWRGSECVHVLHGHTDTVRCCKVPWPALSIEGWLVCTEQLFR
jgi:phospholipase A-2-activating protein